MYIVFQLCVDINSSFILFQVSISTYPDKVSVGAVNSDPLIAHVDRVLVFADESVADIGGCLSTAKFTRELC